MNHDWFVHSYSIRRAAKGLVSSTTLTIGALWVGRTFLQLDTNVWQGGAFGFVAKGVSILVTPLMGQLFKDKLYQEVASHLLGGLLAYGASECLLSLGFIVTHITVPMALTLTIISIATLIFNRSDKETRIYGAVVYDDVSYLGSLKNETPHGYGIMRFLENGSIYKGFFNQGKMDGLGTLAWPDGEVWRGEWKSGKLSGKATVYEPKGKHTISGEKVGDEWQGHFTFSFQDEDFTEHRYEGECKDDVPNGHGTYTWTRIGSFKPTVYVGAWKEGVRQGEGTLTLEDGTQLKGPWYKNKKHGIFILTAPDGKKSNRLYTNDDDQGEYSIST